MLFVSCTSVFVTQIDLFATHITMSNGPTIQAAPVDGHLAFVFDLDMCLTVTFHLNIGLRGGI